MSDLLNKGSGWNPADPFATSSVNRTAMGLELDDMPTKAESLASEAVRTVLNSNNKVSAVIIYHNELRITVERN